MRIDNTIALVEMPKTAPADVATAVPGRHRSWRGGHLSGSDGESAVRPVDDRSQGDRTPVRGDVGTGNERATHMNGRPAAFVALVIVTHCR